MASCLRKLLLRVNSAHDVFGLSSGVYLFMSYYTPDAPESVGLSQLPYGPEVLGLRCAAPCPRCTQPARVRMHHGSQSLAKAVLHRIVDFRPCPREYFLTRVRDAL